MKKIVGLTLLSMGLACSAFAANRVGPVSQYGQLQAGKNSAGKGRIYGSCPAYSTSGNEVAVQGMSLFWSMTRTAGIDFWNGDVVKGLVDKHKIQLIRAPMGVDGSWENDVGNYYTNGMHETAMNTVVQAAIDNDIYVLIDYHSHCAENNTSGAAQFFGKMAQKWGKYDNVIFEIYNEPKNGDCDWSGWYDADGAKDYWKRAIYPYANTVINEIRKYSDNLVVVGTPYYDQYVDAALAQTIDDQNVAYTFHYYAGEDPYRHKVDVLGKNPENMMDKGYSVFVTEWGNSAPSGDGGFTASYSTQWYNWMKQHQLSGANWSVSNKAETASYFNTGVSGSTPASQWSYTESGNWTNQNVFAALPASYTACDNSVPPVQSSSSVAPKSSSSSIPQSSSSISSSSAVPASSSGIAPKSSNSIVPASSSSSLVPKSSSSLAPRSSSSSVAPASSSVVEPNSSSSLVPPSSSSLVPPSSSSSLVASSSSVAAAATLKIYGSLEQTVARNSPIEPITLDGVTGFTRQSWNIYFLDIPQSPQDGKVTIGGSVPGHLQEGLMEETLAVNGQEVKIKLNIVAAAASSSSSADSEGSSSSNASPVPSSSSNGNAMAMVRTHVSSFELATKGRTLLVSGAEDADVTVFDLQGRPMAYFKKVNGTLNLETLASGNYIVHVSTGSLAKTGRITLK